MPEDMARLPGDNQPGEIKSPTRKPLTAEHLREVLHYDSETGEFVWLPRQTRPHMERTDKTWNARYVGKVAGSTAARGYRQIKIDGRMYKAHRLAFLYMTNECPDEVDHIDGDPSNNRWSNIRAATHSENLANRGPPKNNTSGFAGIACDKARRKWQAKLCTNYKDVHLGYFDTAREAALHYDMAARILHGPYACLNFPPEDSDHILLPTRALEHINRALFGERVDWLTAMMAQNDTIRMINESAERQCGALGLPFGVALRRLAAQHATT